MKITIESGEESEPYRESASVRISDDSTCDECLDKMLALMIMYGYHTESVKEAILEKAGEFDSEDIQE